jgi:hypothetical protein
MSDGGTPKDGDDEADDELGLLLHRCVADQDYFDGKNIVVSLPSVHLSYLPSTSSVVGLAAIGKAGRLSSKKSIACV